MFPWPARPFTASGEPKKPDGPGICPCGEPAAFGQIWATEWYDRTGLVERYIILNLCDLHRARRHGED